MTDKETYPAEIVSHVPQAFSSRSGEAEPSQDESFDPWRYWIIIRRHLWGILGLAVSISLLNYLILLSQTPIYRATASMIIDPQEQKVVSVEELYGVDTKSQAYYHTQLEILKSRTLARKVIEALNLSSHPEFAGKPAVPVPVPSPAPADGAVPEFSAVADPGADVGPDGRRASSVLSMLLDWRSWLLLKTPDPPAPSTLAPDPVDKLVDAFLGRLTVTGIRNTQLVQVSFDAATPELAMKAANAVCDAYIDSEVDARSEGTQTASKWLSTRLEGLHQKLNESELRLQSYLEQQRLVDLPAGASSSGVSSLSASQLTELNARYIEARKERLEVETLYGQIAGLGDHVPENIESMPAIDSDDTVRSLKQQEHDASTRVNELSSRYGTQHPERVIAETHLASIRAALKKQIASVAGRLKQQIVVARANENAIVGQIESLKDELQDISRKESVYRELQREAQSNRDLYEMFFKRLKETSEAGDLQPPSARVMDHAILPRIPIRPDKRKGAIIAFVLALAAGIGLAFLLDIMDKSFRSPEEVEQKLGVPLLGLLPLISLKQKRTYKEDLSRVFLDDPKSAFAESVRTVRTGIMLSSLDNPRLSILVTSSTEGEGKTTTALSLAIALAQLNSKVLVVEADMRRPSLSKQCGLSVKLPGLSGLVTHTESIESCIHHFEQGNIDILPAGLIPPNPLELISSRRFAEIMAELENTYDAILFDAPPLQPVSDALALSRLVRSVIYVVQAEKTPKYIVRAGIERLRKAGAPLTGVVLNQLNLEKGRRYYGDQYYSGYYYQYGYSRSKDSDD